MKGTVKWFNDKKGYGFITDTEGNDVFIHHSQIQLDGFRRFDEGDFVEFELGTTETNNRTQAINVQPVLTLAMITHELSKERLHPMRIRDKDGYHGWYVADKEENAVVDKEMSLVELAAYAGIDIEGLEN